MNKVLIRIREFGLDKKNISIIKACIMVILIAMLSSAVFFISYSDDVNKGLADNLIRLHVIANSDSKEDQELKREIRDFVLGHMDDKLSNSKNLEETKNIINNNLNSIQELVQKEIIRRGKDYKVEVMLGSYPFPTKVYGDVTLPAGYYEALRIVIGKGEGANWWCVLFPPLCFVDATHGTVPDSVKEDLKNVLTTEEYSIIVSADNDEDIPVRIKFKIVEFFQNSKIKFSGIISKIFK